MKYIYRLLRVAEKRRWIGPEELQASLGEWIVLGGPPLQVGRTDASALGLPDELPDEVPED